MLSFRASMAFALFAAMSLSPVFGSRIHRAPTSGHKQAIHAQSKHRQSSHAHHGPKRRTKARRSHGQQAIEPARVTQIQQALIREHYLNGEADGNWDARTQSAMQKYQADQGWQTKLMPDSRAILKLGIGHDYSDAINAKDS